MLSTRFETAEQSRSAARWLTAALALHLLAGFFSAGFHQTDEHFQILEFASFKLGRTPPSELAIEFHHAIRSWLQPLFAILEIRTLEALGITSPFAHATLLRLLSALLGWISLVALALRVHDWLPPGTSGAYRLWVTRLLGALWFLPALHARFSSESWAGSFFWIGAALLGAAPPSRMLIAGALWGLAFQFRFQVGAMIGGAGLWLLFGGPRGSASRPRLPAVAAMAAGFLAVSALGLLIDRWGYGTWTLSPWNYFRYNLLQNRVSELGVVPWWDYFRRAVTEAWPALGLLTLASFPVLWLRHPRSLLTWATLPFSLLHLVIGHKELRFLYPMAMAAPFSLVLALLSAQGKLALAHPSGSLRRSALGLLVALNFMGLAFLTFSPAWPPIRLLADIRTLNPAEIFFLDEGPYRVLGVSIWFYRPPGVLLTRIQGPSELARLQARATFPESSASSKPEGAWYFSRRSALTPDDPAWIREHCEPAFSSLPRALFAFKPWQNAANWTLYRCHP